MTKNAHEYRTEDICYIAGIIDGEGSFNLYRSSATKICSRVYVVNTYKPLIDWLHHTFGGLTYERHHKVWKTRYEWIFEKPQIKDLCIAIFPYLKVKREQAKIMIEFRDTILPKGNRLSLETRQLREDLYTRLKHLNSRSG